MASLLLILFSLVSFFPSPGEGILPEKAAPGHALYLGVVQVDHTSGGQRAEVTIKVFGDDLQSALRNAYAEFRPNAGPGECCARNGLLMERYFSEHFQCTVNGKSLNTQLSSCRQENDVFLLGFTMDCPKEWADIEISADFFMELFPEQSNMVTVYHGDQKRFFRVTRVRTSVEADFASR